MSYRMECPKCRAPNAKRIDGSKLDPVTHFKEVKYLVCNVCGYEKATRLLAKKESKK